MRIFIKEKYMKKLITTERYSCALNTCIAISTIFTAIFAYHTWQDSRYIYQVNDIVDAYYEKFTPSISGNLPLEMYPVHFTIKNIDLDKVAKNTNFSKDFPSDTNWNKENEQLINFYKEEISKNILESTPNPFQLVSSLEKIKPFLSEKLKDDIEDFIVTTKITELNFYKAKKDLIYKADNQNDNFNKLLDAISEQHESFKELINNIRNHLGI